MKNTGSKRTLKAGGYSLAVCALATVVVVLVNLFVGALPGKYTKFDTSSTKVLSFSDETKEIVSSVNEDVTMYLVAESGTEDALVKEALDRYSALNSKIKVEHVDPTVSPNFVSKYTKENISGNSVIVVSERRSTVADSGKFYMFSTDYGNISAEEYEYIKSYYEMYGQSFRANGKVFCLEVLLTSAIDYVTSESIPTLYALSSHGETEFSETMLGYIDNESIDVDSLKLLGAGKVPDDCSCIYIGNPSSDITADEAKVLKDYLASGGNIILTTLYSSYSSEKMPNLASVCEYMGMRSVDGIVVEGNTSNYYRIANYLLPNISSSGFIESSDRYVLMPSSHGIEAIDGVDGITVKPILKTSSSSYIKPTDQTIKTLEREEGDKDGPTYVGAMSERGTGENEKTGKLIWFSSPGIVDETVDSTVSGGNSDLFMQCLLHVTEKSTSVSVIAKEFLDTTMTMTFSSVVIWGIVMVVVLPLAILAVGFAVWYRRRRR